MFKDKTVWITGASSGIGEALALQFAGQGARIVLSARRIDELDRVRDACTSQGLAAGSVLVLPLDVTDFESMPAAVSTVCNTFGRVDMLINNAGISQRSLCVDTDMSVYRKLFEDDVPIALLQHLREHRLGQGDLAQHIDLKQLPVNRHIGIDAQGAL